MGVGIINSRSVALHLDLLLGITAGVEAALFPDVLLDISARVGIVKLGMHMTLSSWNHKQIHLITKYVNQASFDSSCSF